jgi:hypothetical protein
MAFLTEITFKLNAYDKKYDQISVSVLNQTVNDTAFPVTGSQQLMQ